MAITKKTLRSQAKAVTLVLTDCDGVLTDGGVYYGESGEMFKRFHIRDGMGVERLRAAGIETGIVSGETSPSLAARARKLGITRVHLGIKDKLALLRSMKAEAGTIAFLGDDVNDLEILKAVGLSACPRDAVPEVVRRVDYRCRALGGHGAFRELAELILSSKS